ncbi:choline transporter-like protein 1 isoform X2 [Zophobas morio]
MSYETDNCGNFCGLRNPLIQGVPCSGKDFTMRRELDAKGECDYFNTEKLFGQMYRTFEEDNPFEDDFDTSTQNGSVWWRLVSAIFITTALGILTLVLLRFAPAPFVWGILIFSILVLLGTTGLLWTSYFQGKDVFDERSISLAPVLAWTIFAVTILIIFMVIFKRIGLVIQLYKETTKVLAAMPLVVFFPIFIAFIQMIVFMAVIVTTICIWNFKELTKRDENVYKYELSGVAILTIVFNIFVATWAMRFVSGVQSMTIAGGVARWYFSKNKDHVNSPVWSSFKVTLKYHLGTIAFGSLLMTLFAVVKMFLKLCCRNSCCKCCEKFCCNQAEVLLKFLSGNSYILTAIHGQSFLRSARRATKLVLTNIGNIVAINCVGDFILAVIIIVLSVLATAISFALFKDTGPVGTKTAIGCFFINTVIIYVIFGTFQTIIDSLFICFCEDSVMNDGISRPYYMSRGLKEFMENSKKEQERHTRQ